MNDNYEDVQDDIVASSREMMIQRLNDNFEPILDSKCWEFGDGIDAPCTNKFDCFIKEGGYLKRYESVAFKGLVGCELQAQDFFTQSHQMHQEALSMQALFRQSMDR